MEQTVLTVLVVPAALFTVMVGLGLSLTVDDFRRVVHDRKVLGVGLIGQMALLPVLGALIVICFRLEPVFGLGLMVLALSPGGALSNAVVHVVRGELALSISLTAISSIVTPVTIPVLYRLSASYLTPETETVSLPIGKTMLQLFLICIVPVALGMAVRKGWPTFAIRADKPVRVLSVVFFVIVIGGVIKQHLGIYPVGFRSVGPAVLALNLGSLTLGFVGARLARLNFEQAATIAIEVGMQNAATATFVTATLLGDTTMAIVPAIYATVMLPSALIFGVAAGSMRRNATVLHASR
ncbi:MAG: bile acid:sodium symporter family protein [Planctomycetales bacterium]|nr:bile acid:sodium symporter family protein [Planctomycetales bacterium]